jgi:tetratricopeptide (TPR) repeat protein
MSPSPLLLQSVALLARESLRGAEVLPPVPRGIEQILGEALDELPPQWHAIGSAAPRGRWIELAALLEGHGAWDDAWDLLAAVAEVATLSDASPNFAAFLSARRGRIARQAGRLDTADACYMGALAMADRHENTYFTDVYPSAWLGRCVLAVERGNYPQARRFAKRAIAPGIPLAHHAQAYQMLALIDRKAGRLDAALSHLWQAHDLGDMHPAHHAAILGALAEVAAERGEGCAALRAWVSILRVARAPRMVTPTLISILNLLGRYVTQGDPCRQCLGLLRAQPWASAVPLTETIADAARHLIDQTSAIAVGDRPLVGLGVPLTPHDFVELQITRSRLLMTLGEHQRGAAVANVAHQMAETLGFHERLFQAEPLLGEPSTTSRPKKGSPGSKAMLRRFFDLESGPLNVAGSLA